MTTSFDRDWRRIKELVEVLAGERGEQSKSQRAVRLGELQGLVGIGDAPDDGKMYARKGGRWVEIP